jgi:hypothetical protein
MTAFYAFTSSLDFGEPDVWQKTASPMRCSFMSSPARSPTERLRNLIAELQLTDNNLKTDPNIEGAVLRELRHALDNLRLTAWTVSELQNARDTSKDVLAMTSFLTAERMRRIRRMIDDFCTDLERDGAALPALNLNDLQESVSSLRERLALLSFRRHRS